MSYPVELYIYDLTRGMASSIAPMLGINFDVEGIWHTAIVVHGREWFFGAGGIESCPPGTTMLGSPLRTENLGTTAIDAATFNDYVHALSTDQFAGHKYDLFKHNCNNFSNTVAKFLSGRQIPQYILDLPERFLRTPVAQMIRPWIEQMTPQNVGGQPPQPSAPREEAATNFGNQASARAKQSFKHFPVTEYLTFNSEIDMAKLKSKLEEFNSAKDPDKQLTKGEIDCVMSGGENTWWDHSRKVLETWSCSETFPVLDLIRWRLSRGAVTDSQADQLYLLLTGKRYLGGSADAPEPAVRLSLRTIANMFAASGTARAIMIRNRESFVGLLNDVVESVSGIEPETKRQHSEVAAATIALNYARSIAATHTDNAEEATFQLVSALCFTFSQNVRSPEALYRTLVALGTLGVAQPQVISLAQDLDVKSFLAKAPKAKLDKLDEVISEAKSVFL